MKQIREVRHYSINDPECRSDYHRLELFVDGKLVLDLTDEYHDKSSSQVEGFMKALHFLGFDYIHLEENFADSED